MLDINLNFKDLSNKTVTGKVTLTFKHNGTALVSNSKDLKEITLNAEDFENVNVTSLDKNVEFRYDGHYIYLSWKESFQKSEERKVLVEYTLDHPIAGLYWQQPDDIMKSENPTWAITDHEPEK